MASLIRWMFSSDASFCCSMRSSTFFLRSWPFACEKKTYACNYNISMNCFHETCDTYSTYSVLLVTHQKLLRFKAQRLHPRVKIFHLGSKCSFSRIQSGEKHFYWKPHRGLKWTQVILVDLCISFTVGVCWTIFFAEANNLYIINNLIRDCEDLAQAEW